MIPILIESNFNANSWLGLVVTRWKYLTFSHSEDFMEDLQKHIKMLTHQEEKSYESKVVKVLYDFEASKPSEISVQANETCTVLSDNLGNMSKFTEVVYDKQNR